VEAATGDDGAAEAASGDGAAGDDGATGTDGATASDGAAGDDGATEAAAGDDGGADAGTAADANDAAASVDATTVDASEGGASTDAASCDYTGTWASEITISVHWNPAGAAAVILAPGDGVIKQWVLSTRTQSGSTLSDTAQVCGIVLPDFNGSQFGGGELYGMTFADGLFDNSDIPTFALTGTMTGTTYSSQYATPLIGLTLANPTTATWPANASAINQVDMDSDGEHGVTATAKASTGYSLIPVNLLKTNRADKLYLAIRQVTKTTATASDCDHMAGTVTVPQIGGAYAIDSHIIGCHVSVDPINPNRECTTTGGNAESTFVDDNRPIFTPPTDAGTAFPSTFTSLRMPAGTTCAQVRAQLP
jgi:hypothetical protein